MDIKNHAMALTKGAKSRWTEDRNDRVERENDRLRVENRALKSEVERDRDRLSTLLDSLEATSTILGTIGGKKPHRLRRLFLVTAAATGAYVMGTKAGRERYEQIRDRWSQLRDHRMSQAREAAQEWAGLAGSSVEDAGAKASDAIQAASQKAATTVTSVAGSGDKGHASAKTRSESPRVPPPFS